MKTFEDYVKEITHVHISYEDITVERPVARAWKSHFQLRDDYLCTKCFATRMEQFLQEKILQLLINVSWKRQG